MYQQASRRRCQILQLRITFLWKRLGSHITTIQVLLCCSLNYGRRPCKLPRAHLRSLVNQNSTLSFKWRESSAEWVRGDFVCFTDFVLKCRYPGCHVLALDLVRSWSFERPSIRFHNQELDSPNSTGRNSLPPSPTSSRRPIFPLDPALRRRSSIKIDMDILALSPPRSASPTLDDFTIGSGGGKKPTERTSHAVPTVPNIKEEDNDTLSRKAGLGNLMKSAKQDVQVPEFDMSAFM